jgi:hypothetical protein
MDSKKQMTWNTQARRSRNDMLGLGVGWIVEVDQTSRSEWRWGGVCDMERKQKKMWDNAVQALGIDFLILIGYLYFSEKTCLHSKDVVATQDLFGRSLKNPSQSKREIFAHALQSQSHFHKGLILASLPIPNLPLLFPLRFRRRLGTSIGNKAIFNQTPCSYIWLAMSQQRHICSLIWQKW